MKAQDHAIPLGIRVRDVVTGFEGITMGRTQWLTGCNTVGVNPGTDAEGKLREVEWFDENRCEIIDATVVNLVFNEASTSTESAVRGGPQDRPRRSRG